MSGRNGWDFLTEWFVEASKHWSWKHNVSLAASIFVPLGIYYKIITVDNLTTWLTIIMNAIKGWFS